jgi:LPS sulfotransferase NodH
MWNYFGEVVRKLREMPEYQGLPVEGLLPVVFPNLHYIWIVRRDKVRQAVSWAKAAQTGVYAWIGDDPPIPAKEPHFDFTLIDNLRRLVLEGEAGWQAYFEACGVNPFMVVYEELVTDYEGTAAAALEYLGVDHSERPDFGQRRLMKQADAVNEEWVRRYMEIVFHNPCEGDPEAGFKPSQG